ncbi:DUF2845 domain-containing protein [Arhodomonas aquaeolei]|uniref:DUF2845 domain-containing protein n=1 Tax=Arhodomonas aquaeolei TaxID=2369 RepID=UPI002168ED7B|nr:DUF2845 domain-containing protein [Arhodomonas aquaeolei]MCS4502562.1 DUF2845 domain-containing protein [Arhodomonas aquaeolei]
MRTAAAFLIAITVLLFSGTATGLRCGSRLIQPGDSTLRVARHCGEPDYIEHRAEAFVPGTGYVSDVEAWYYNRGPQQFLRILTFRNGELVREETGGYGFSSGVAGQCTPNSIRTGMSKLELYSRCGTPAHRRTRFRTGVSDGRRHSLSALEQVDEWVYSFGPTRFNRIVEIVNGEVRSVTVGEERGD